MTIRKAAVAGYFYTDVKEELKNAIDDYLAMAESRQHQVDQVFPLALIIPHAGIEYSGSVAAFAYQRLIDFKDKIKRVVIFGPSHRVPLRGCAVPSADYFETPLGNICVDQKCIAKLLDNPNVKINNICHRDEHSIEVQLPFLQRCLDDFSLVPVVVGQIGAEEFALIIKQVLATEGTLCLFSSDLSHFHSYQDANSIDHLTIKYLLEGKPMEPIQACGSNILNGLIHHLVTSNLSIQLLNYANSGDVGSDQSKVVGYASFIIY